MEAWLLDPGLRSQLFGCLWPKSSRFWCVAGRTRGSKSSHHHGSTAKLAFPLHHQHFPCSTNISPAESCLRFVFSLWNHLGCFFLYYRLYFAAFLFPQHIGPSIAVLQWDFLAIIQPTGVVWKAGCLNTHTKHTISLNWGLRKIALLSSPRLQPGKQQPEAGWGCGWEGPPAAELLGNADPGCMQFSSHVTDFQASPWGSLEVLCAATALHADLVKWIHNPSLLSKELPLTGTKFSSILPCWKMLYRNAKWIH